MLLTGKCKEDFDFWLRTEMYYLGKEDLSELFWNALIFEFFDDKNMVISIKSKYGFRKKKHVFQFEFNNYKSEFMQSREIATSQAIIVANSTYNNRFNNN